MEELTLDSTQPASRLSRAVARAKSKPQERCLAFEIRGYAFYSFVCSYGSSKGSVITLLHNPSASSPLNASTTAGLTLRANNIGRAFYNWGRLIPLSCICAYMPSILPRPSEKTPTCLLKASSTTGIVSEFATEVRANPADEEIPTTLCQ